MQPECRSPASYRRFSYRLSPIAYRLLWDNAARPHPPDNAEE
jgi:hypothetical protein